MKPYAVVSIGGGWWKANGRAFDDLADAVEYTQTGEIPTMNAQKTRPYLIQGRRVGAIGIMQTITTIRAESRAEALEKARHLYSEGWEHLQPLAPGDDYAASPAPKRSEV